MSVKLSKQYKGVCVDSYFNNNTGHFDAGRGHIFPKRFHMFTKNWQVKILNSVSLTAHFVTNVDRREIGNCKIHNTLTSSETK